MIWLLIAAIGVHLDVTGPFESQAQCERVAAKAKAAMRDRAAGIVTRCVPMQGVRT